MGSCTFCKVDTKKQLKSCVCGKVSYCSKGCQAKDWKTHKPSCPPFIIRDSPGKGRGLFATRKIKEGEIILEEYPLITIRGEITVWNFAADYYPNIEDETKAKVLNLNDPADNLKSLNTETVEKLAMNWPILTFCTDANLKRLSSSKSKEIVKMFRIFFANCIPICDQQDLYDDTTEIGLYNNISLINHACVPNATWSWVMDDFRRKQIRAIMTIEKDQEILTSYWAGDVKFVFSSRESRREELLYRIRSLMCHCSECSLEGEALKENERMRAEIREKLIEMKQIMEKPPPPQPLDRSLSLIKAMMLARQSTKLVQKLNIRMKFMDMMISHYRLTVVARGLGMPCENEQDICKQEAWKYAKIFGDPYIHEYKKIF